MKKSFNSQSNLLVSMKNFWFGVQLFIVSVSLPVMCFMEMSRKSNTDQQEKVMNNSAKQKPIADKLAELNPARLS